MNAFDILTKNPNLNLCVCVVVVGGGGGGGCCALWKDGAISKRT